jgi:hypothetical protein
MGAHTQPSSRRDAMLYTLLVLLLIVVLAIIIWRAVAGRTV